MRLLAHAPCRDDEPKTHENNTLQEARIGTLEMCANPPLCTYTIHDPYKGHCV
jgi:hypothetical protein